MNIVITRPQAESASWRDALRGAGHSVVELPLMDVQPVQDTLPLVQAWGRVHTFDAVMFVSANAVRHFFAVKPDALRVFETRYPIKTRAMVTGPGSMTALIRAGAETERIDMPAPAAAQFDSEALWEVMGHRVKPGWKLLVVRGAGAGGTGEMPVETPAGAEPVQGQGRDWFARQVEAHGGSVEFVVAYRRVLPQWHNEHRVQAAHAATDGSLWLLTSSEALDNLRNLCPAVSWARARALVTHPRIGQAAMGAGFGLVSRVRPALADVLASLKTLQ